MKFCLLQLLQNTAQAWWTTGLLLVLPSLFLFLLQTICTYLLEILPLALTAEFCTSLVENSTTFGTPEFGNSMAINMFYWCLDISHNLSHCTHRFLAGLFTFLSRWPIVNWLRASKRNHFRTIITTILPWIFSFFSSSLFSCCKMWSVPHANEWQETRNVGRN